MKKGLIVATLMLSIMIFGINKVKAEELEYITPIGTSLHTYISVTHTSVSNTTIYYDSPSYREITSSQGSYTFSATSGSMKTINKLAFNVFGNFQVNNSYKIRWETRFPNGIDLDQYTCSMGSYDNNTAYPPWSLSSCEIKRSSSGYMIMEGTITIEKGQYVTLIISPRTGIDINRNYDIIEDNLPMPLDYNFTLSYGTPQILKVLPISVAIGGLATNIDSVTNAVNNSTNNITNAVSNSTSSIINEDTTYNNNASENLNGQTEMDNLDQSENNLMGSLDFSGINNLNIIINPEASAFIWQIAELLRGMNGAIALLITSILGLGIIKMVLNR